ncbi:MAG TPA: D-alanyl-D-alanine carboxypeptidase family protein [Thermodesulfobacteriota bacterium]|nr:D-alanyl-D-alanine carboxypeptidase family protein [Thermodesulfobacteriota bacterium]
MSINGPFRNRLRPALTLSLLFMVFPNQVFPQTAQPNLKIDAKCAVLMDSISGRVLFEQNSQLKIAPASFVKLLTLYIAFDTIRDGHLKMDDLVTVSQKAWRMGGSKMFIKAGEKVRVENLLRGVAVVAGNDACVALAERIAGSEEVFVSKMNEKGKLLGLKDSQFRNSHGMPTPDQYTTASDIAILARRYIEDHPEGLALHSLKEFGYQGIVQQNRNTLLRKGIGVDGLMTGYLEGSGFHLVATAKRDGQRMMAVVMGSGTIQKRALEAQKLLEYGFKNFSTVQALKKSDLFGPEKVAKGKLNKVHLIPAEEAWVTVGKGKENSISVISDVPKPITAPVQKGQGVGRLVIQSEGKVLKEVGLLSSSDIPEGIYLSWPLIAIGISCFLLVGLFAFWLVNRSRRKKFRSE